MSNAKIIYIIYNNFFGEDFICPSSSFVGKEQDVHGKVSNIISVVHSRSLFDCFLICLF